MIWLWSFPILCGNISTTGEPCIAMHNFIFLKSLSTFTFLVEYGKTFYLVTKVNKISVQPCTNKMCKEFYRFKTSDVMCKELHQQFNVNIVELCVCSFHWPYFECFIMVLKHFSQVWGRPGRESLIRVCHLPSRDRDFSQTAETGDRHLYQGEQITSSDIQVQTN